jgi:hypothetical protein
LSVEIFRAATPEKSPFLSKASKEIRFCKFHVYEAQRKLTKHKLSHASWWKWAVDHYKLGHSFCFVAHKFFLEAYAWCFVVVS